MPLAPLANLLRQFGQTFPQARLFIVDVGLCAQHPVRLNKDNALVSPFYNPQDEVGVEAALFEKADALAAAQVAQQIDFLACQRLVLFRFPIGSQVADKLRLALLQRRRVGSYLVASLEQQGQVETAVEMNARQTTVFLIDEFIHIGAKLLEGLYKILPRTRHAHGVGGFLFLHAGAVERQVGVVQVQRAIDQVLAVPLLVTAAAIGVHIFAQDGGNGLLKTRAVMKRARLENGIVGNERIRDGLQNGPRAFGSDDQVVPALACLIPQHGEIGLFPIHQRQRFGLDPLPGSAAGQRFVQTGRRAFQGLHFERQIHLDTNVRIGGKRQSRFSGEIAALFRARHYQPFLQKLFIGPDKEGQLDDRLGLHAFALQIVAELRHVVGAHGKDIERLQQLDVGGMSSRNGGAAPEAHPLALQAHAAAKELDDLRAFLPPDVQEAHVGHAPGVPALHEFFGADEDGEAGIGTADAAKQRGGEGVFFQRHAGRVGFHQFLEFCNVADVNQAEVVLCASGFQPQFAGSGANGAQMQAAARRRMEQPFQDVGIEGLRRQAGFFQVLETPGEEVHTVRRDQAAFAGQQFADALDHPAALVFQDVMKEARHGQHVAAFLSVFAIDGVDGAAHEHPERLFQVVGAQRLGLFFKNALLLVKRKQVAQKKQFGCGFIGFIAQVEDAKVLAVAVAVEVTV